MQVFQTAGDPPNKGRIILANIGSIQKSRVALTNKESANSNSTGKPPMVALYYNNYDGKKLSQNKKNVNFEEID